jgi:hypothetical protein
MSKALDREMAKLAAMGVTVTTTARAGEDSIAGRIQAAAERQGIAGGVDPLPCAICHGRDHQTLLHGITETHVAEEADHG